MKHIKKPIPEIKLKFAWTDELALEFAKVCTQGSYGKYRGSKSAEQKLEIFKKIVLKRETSELISVCSICEENYIGYGNNAQPINDGECCDSCNTIVITTRTLQSLKENENEQ